MTKISVRLTVLFFLFIFPARAESLDGNNVLQIDISGPGPVYDFQVELALDNGSQAEGLMNREELPENQGMLFFFKDERFRSFWMKDTLIPLDIIFIRSDGTISSIRENAVPLDETPIGSEEPVRAVLEINGGMVSKLGIEEGDIVLHPFFGK
jgi:hypothetical protein